MINLDSEELGVIIISSAGGGGTQYTIPFTREPSDDWEALRIEVGGLMGGHSGVDIHLPRVNSNILLAQGLRKVKEEPDLVILDITLPGIDGLEICCRLRAETQTVGLPILMLSARALESDR